MSKYRLTYFHGKGNAEVCRLIFAAAGQEYEDKRIHHFTEHDQAKVMQMKAEERQTSDEWLELKPKVPFGQLPVLEVDGHEIAQSKVIATFLARRFGLAGKTDIDDARAAMIAETCHDVLQDAVAKLFVEKDEEKRAEAVAKYTSETLPNMLAKLEQQVGKNGYFVADQLTHADIAFYFKSEWPAMLKVEIDWTKYPKLKAVWDNVTKNPGIAKWLKERPETLL